MSSGDDKLYRVTVPDGRVAYYPKEGMAKAFAMADGTIEPGRFVGDTQRCWTCKHWGVGSQLMATKSYLDDGKYVTVPITAKACGNPQLVDIDGHGKGYAAIEANGFGLDYPVCDFITGPDFGCIHWEAKE